MSTTSSSPRRELNHHKSASISRHLPQDTIYPTTNVQASIAPAHNALMACHGPVRTLIDATVLYTAAAHARSLLTWDSEDTTMQFNSRTTTYPRKRSAPACGGSLHLVRDCLSPTTVAHNQVRFLLMQCHRYATSALQSQHSRPLQHQQRTRRSSPASKSRAQSVFIHNNTSITAHRLEVRHVRERARPHAARASRTTCSSTTTSSSSTHCESAASAFCPQHAASTSRLQQPLWRVERVRSSGNSYTLHRLQQRFIPTPNLTRSSSPLARPPPTRSCIVARINAHC